MSVMGDFQCQYALKTCFLIQLHRALITVDDVPVIYSYFVLPFNLSLFFLFQIVITQYCHHTVALQWPWDSPGNYSPCLTSWLIKLLLGGDQRPPLWIEMKYICQDFPSTHRMFSKLLCPISQSKRHWCHLSLPLFMITLVGSSENLDNAARFKRPNIPARYM